MVDSCLPASHPDGNNLPDAPTAPASSSLFSSSSPIDELAADLVAGAAVRPQLAQRPSNTSFGEGTVPPSPFPLPAAPSTDLPTPLHEDARPELSVNLQSALPPSNVSLPTPPLLRQNRGLRLPSFDTLGIANPHPDRMPLFTNNSFSSLGAGPLSKPEDPLHAMSPAFPCPAPVDGADELPLASPRATKAELEHLVPTITPPSEPGTFHWGSLVNVRTTAMGSPPSSDPGGATIGAISEPGSSALPDISAAAPAYDMSGTGTFFSWIEVAKGIITQNIHTLPDDSVKVLSHALPCPCRAGHVFPAVIDAIHSQTPNKPTSWINVFHAVPGRFNLAELPTSPPATPGPAVGGESYFTSKVFDSAVAVSDYQGDATLMPPSPRPVVAPMSVDVSIVERYIPPTNLHEYAEMFSLRGRSLLADRMVELSPNNGTLLFIYPTRAGGRTFMKDYLGPILDPTLRSMTVVHRFSSDFGTSLGQMVSVDRLAEYHVLRDSIERFCHQLSDPTVGPERFNGETPRYTLIHASREEVVLQRSVWATDWWIKQEKPRVRTIVTKYFRMAEKLPSEAEVFPINLIQDVVDAVASREYSDGEPTTGVEVGVFIIQKTRPTSS